MFEKSTNIGLFAGDMRIVYIADLLLELGYEISVYDLSSEISHPNCYHASSYKELFSKSSHLIGPIPLSRDKEVVFSQNSGTRLLINTMLEQLHHNHVFIAGCLPNFVTDYCKNQNIKYIDLIENENITILNAIATAEGTIMEAICLSDRNLHSSNCLITGFGRCGKILANKLKALDVNIDIAARSSEALSYAYSYGFKAIHIDELHDNLYKYDFIFNTIPSLIFDKDELNIVKKDCAIIDIASAPGGVDFEYAKELGIKAKLSLGLPGRVSPKTSAEIIVKEISNLLLH